MPAAGVQRRVRIVDDDGRGPQLVQRRGEIAGAFQIQKFPAMNFGKLNWRKYEARKEPMPVACVIGWDPLMPFLAGSPVSPGVCEWDVMGGYRGEPVPLVRCETDVPAALGAVPSDPSARPWFEAWLCSGGAFGTADARTTDDQEHLRQVLTLTTLESRAFSTDCRREEKRVFRGGPQGDAG